MSPLPPADYTADNVLDLLDADGDHTVLSLERGDSSWNPASTSSLVWGPAEVTYIRYPDGGINCIVRDLAAPRKVA